MRAEFSASGWVRHVLLAGALLLVVSPAAGSAAAAAVKERELPSLRTATAETVVGEDGSYRTRLFAHPVHFRQEKQWLPIDNTLVASDTTGYVFENKANAFTAAFKGTVGSGFLRLDLPEGRGSVAVSLQGATAGTALDKTSAGDSVAATGVFAQTDLEYKLVAGGVKETLVLRSPSAPGSFVWTISPLDKADLRPVEQPDGSLLFFADGVAGPLFGIDAPVVADSRADGSLNPDEQGKATLVARPQPDGSVEVTLTVDPAWLADPARVFPVYVDPTYNALTDTQDGYYDETVGGTPNMTGTALNVGKSGSAGSVYGTAVIYDLASIPIGATVTNVFPNLYLTGCLPGSCTAGSTTGTVEMRQLTSGWTNTTAWSAITKNATVLASRLFNAGAGADTINNWYTLAPSGTSLTSTVQGMVNGATANYGFLLEKTGGNANQGSRLPRRASATPPSPPTSTCTGRLPGCNLTRHRDCMRTGRI